jgi:hypothetical protein
MPIPVLRLDIPRPTLVGDASDRADEREMLGLRGDPQELARLEIDGNFDGKPGVRSRRSSDVTRGNLLTFRVPRRPW